MRYGGKNTKQTQFLPSQLQSKSYSWFYAPPARLAKGGTGIDSRREAGVEHRKEPCPSGRGPSPEAHHSKIGPKQFVHRPTKVLDPPAIVGETTKTGIHTEARGGKYETNPIPSKPIAIN